MPSFFRGSMILVVLGVLLNMLVLWPQNAHEPSSTLDPFHITLKKKKNIFIIQMIKGHKSSDRMSSNGCGTLAEASSL